MRIARRISLVSVVGLWALLPMLARAETAASVSLESLFEAARQNHPTLAKQPLVAASLELQQAQLNRAYFPHLSLGGVATWQSDVTGLDLALPNVALSPPPNDQYRVTLELQQSIWDGGTTADKKRVAQSRSRVEHEKVNVEWYQVRDRILQLYFVGVVQQELERQGETLHRYLGTLVEKAQLALTTGVATARDVILVQARQLEARQAIVDARAQLAGVRRSLEDLTATQLPVEAALTAPDTACPLAAAARRTPHTIHRPELSLLSAQSRLLDDQERLDRAVDRPRVGAFATAGYGRPGLNALNDSSDFYFIGGIQLTVPLTHLYAGTSSNGLEQLSVQRSLIARQREAVVAQINVQLDTQITELGRLDEALALDDEILKLRQRAREQTELQLELGTAVLTDLVNDLTQEDQARSRRTLHRAQRNLACQTLAFIKGDL